MPHGPHMHDDSPTIVDDDPDKVVIFSAVLRALVISRCGTIGYPANGS